MLADTPTAFISSEADEIHFSHDVWCARIGPSDDAAVVGAFLGDTLVGSCAMFRQKPAKQRHQALIWGVFVGPQARGQGVARRLLQAMVARAAQWPSLRQVSLAVMSTNKSAFSLYESLGFKTFGVEVDAINVDGTFHAVTHMVKRLHEDDITPGQP